METSWKIPPFLQKVKALEEPVTTSTAKELMVQEPPILVVMDAIPVELAFNRIGKELERDKQFRKAILQTMTILE